MKRNIIFVFFLYFIIIHGGLITNSDFIMEGDQGNCEFASEVSNIGDVNGDGYDDIAIGSYNFDNGETDEGIVLVFYGSENGVTFSSFWYHEGNSSGIGFGYKIIANDVNGDGYNDLLISAPGYSNGESNEGKVFLYYGSATGLSDTSLWNIEMNQTNALLGYDMCSAGDINRDGYGDIVISAPLIDYSQIDEGCVMVFYGSVTGLSNGNTTLLLGNADSLFFGFSISGKGDINGDGYNDLLISASNYSNDQVLEGKVFLYYGDSTGISDTASWTMEGNQDSCKLGEKVSFAGDVNGDGYSDILIASPSYDSINTDCGKIDLYLGSAIGPTAIPDYTVIGENANEKRGNDLSYANLNGDLYSDIIIGAPGYYNGSVNSGAFFIYYGSSNSIDTSDMWSSIYGQADSKYGFAISGVGDVNGDGYDDMLVGAPDYDNEDTDEGIVYLFYGSISGLSKDEDWLGTISQSYTSYGIDVSKAGDVNGDGYDDIIIGASDYDGASTDNGAVFVYYGSANGLSSNYNWSDIGTVFSEKLGFSVSFAGDINGDGYDDIISGAPYYNNGQSEEGAVYIYYGSATGLPDSVNEIIESDTSYIHFGWDVSYAGDVNADNYDDIIVGEPDYESGSSLEGAAYLYLGNSSGINTTYSWRVESNNDNANMGKRVSFAGDVNGDGYDDVLIGAPNYSSSLLNSGIVYLFYGNASGLDSLSSWYKEGVNGKDFLGYGLSAGDLNADGYSDICIGIINYDDTEIDEGCVMIFYGDSNGILSDTADCIIQSNQDSTCFGYALSANGDINNDGYDDLVVGSYKYKDEDYNRKGAAFAYLGSPSGVDTNCIWSHIGGINPIYFAKSISFAGDVNGDGYDDVIIGQDNSRGSAYLYYGDYNNILSIMQMRSDEIAPIVAPLYSSIDGTFKIAVKLVSEKNAKLQWEVKPLGEVFDGLTIYESSDFYDISDTATIIEQISDLTSSQLYKWRIRVLYDDSSKTRWFYLSDNSPEECDVNIGDIGSSGLFEDFNISAIISKKYIKLYWIDEGDSYKIYKNNNLIGGTASNFFIDLYPNIGVNEYKVNVYNNGKNIKSNTIKILFMQQNILDKLNSIYFNKKILNKIIKDYDLNIYTIEGRKIEKIKNSGEYYIIDKQSRQIINKRKIIVIE